MWIRSQDKRSIVVLERASSICVMKYRAPYCAKPLCEKRNGDFFIEASGRIIGTYPTEERAIEVLDEICNTYLDLNIEKGNEYVGFNSNVDYFGGYVKNGVYQMPEV